MAIYEITADKIVAFDETSFEKAGLRERGDLQRLLRAQVEVVCPDVLVIAEGFREWEDSRREIDLLAVVFCPDELRHARLRQRGWSPPA